MCVCVPCVVGGCVCGVGWGGCVGVLYGCIYCYLSCLYYVDIYNVDFINVN